MTDKSEIPLANIGPVEYSIGGHYFYYDPDNMKLRVDTTTLDISVQEDDHVWFHVWFAELICPHTKNPLGKSRCIHRKRARKLLFPYLAEKAFFHYAEKAERENLSFGDTYRLMSNSLEEKIGCTSSHLNDFLTEFENGPPAKSGDLQRKFFEYVRRIKAK